MCGPIDYFSIIYLVYQKEIIEEVEAYVDNRLMLRYILHYFASGVNKLLLSVTVKVL